MKGTALLGILATSVIITNAHQRYGAAIPNGKISIDGAVAFGHVDGVNGGGDRSQFGLDFAEAGNVWTRELCEMDSNENGRTNGVDLGDPCCTWQSYSGAAPITDASRLSNPGDPNSKAANPPTCEEVQQATNVNPTMSPAPATNKKGGAYC